MAVMGPRKKDFSTMLTTFSGEISETEKESNKGRGREEERHGHIRIKPEQTMRASPYASGLLFHRLSN
jgi:hypothetical protein